MKSGGQYFRLRFRGVWGHAPQQFVLVFSCSETVSGAISEAKILTELLNICG